MLRVAWLLASVVAAAGGSGAGGSEIRAADGAVTIRAQGLPLSQILDRLSAATGMAVTYEGTRPGNPITISVEGISETEAILKLMEGNGISYVFQTDASGQRVDRLIVSGSGPGRLVASSGSSQAAPPEQPYEEPQGDYGQIPLDPAAVEAAGPQVKPDFNNPYLGMPAQHFPPQPAPVEMAQPAADVTGSSSRSGSRNTPIPGTGPMPGNGPGNAPIPGPPVFPTGSSYPSR